MIIAINGRVLTERAGGPARYTKNIIHEISKIDRDNQYIIFVNKDYSFDFDIPYNFKLVKYKTWSRFLFDYIFIPLYSYRYKIDIFLFPKNTYAPYIRGKKIPVYHDIIYYENVDFREFKFFDHFHHKFMIPLAAKFSAVDLTVSDFTASRMEELLHIDKKKIRIIKEGVEESFQIISDKSTIEKIKKKNNITAPFFFYTGSSSPRKNLVRIFQAFASVADKIPHNLYFTAPSSWNSADLEGYISKHNLENRIKKLGYISDDELIVLYNIAEAYLYPSLYEGFGLPILEAQACGCPVITSNISSCPEVADESAVLVDPYKVSEIADAMVKLASDRAYRDDIINKGLKNYKRFSWTDTARGIVSLFNEYS